MLILDSAFLIVSPLLLLLNRRCRYKKTVLTGIIISILFFNYGFIIPNYLPFNPANPYFPIQKNLLIDVLYANDFVLFPIALWSVPYLIGSLLSMLGFEKRRNEAIMIFSIITIVLGYIKLANNETLLLNPYIFPLMPYYVFVCFFALFVFVQIFIWLEKLRSRKINAILATLRLYGDNSLKIYIYHWMAIDLSIRVFYPNLKMIWLIMAVYLSTYTYRQRGLIMEYLEHAYKTGHYKSRF